MHIDLFLSRNEVQYLVGDDFKCLILMFDVIDFLMVVGWAMSLQLSNFLRVFMHYRVMDCNMNTAVFLKPFFR